ncbi:hypothetical protein AXG93_3016s1440 [Marchantia polymorpha subsp. ruderalis]|uniref:Uncharacterized protein n=1 Tax=Marchantia polymorpha subsp. ruderalis TaxID=1480154 RepID=A0A176WBV5_MARPO|nr:hypothetical protein AXG93_3016s1440 [Marchantia polymorpha subsp. ruderalis]
MSPESLKLGEEGRVWPRAGGCGVSHWEIRGNHRSPEDAAHPTAAHPQPCLEASLTARGARKLWTSDDQFVAAATTFARSCDAITSLHLHGQPSRADRTGEEKKSSEAMDDIRARQPASKQIPIDWRDNPSAVQSRALSSSTGPPPHTLVTD